MRDRHGIILDLRREIAVLKDKLDDQAVLKKELLRLGREVKDLEDKLLEADK